MLERFIGGFLFHPAAMDYSGDTCRNGCAYCFANINQVSRKSNLVGAVNRLYKKNATTYDDMLLKEGYPICFSNRSDPFTERTWRDTLALFGHLAEMPNGVFIQTKCGPGMEEALDALGADKNAAIYITVTTLQDDLARVIEPNAPPPSERLRIAEDLHRRGYLVVIAVNPCCEQWMPPDDLEALCVTLRGIGVKHICLEMLDMSRNRLKIVPKSRKTRMGEAALDDCRTGKVRIYTRECTEYLAKEGFIVAKRGMPFRTRFFDDLKARLGKVMPVHQDFVNYCFDHHADGAAVAFDEFDRVIRGDLGGVWERSVTGSAIRDYLFRAGFVAWKANQRVPTMRDLLRIVWNDPRARFSIQGHCLFRLTNRTDDEGNALLWFDGKANLGKKKEVMQL